MMLLTNRRVPCHSTGGNSTPAECGVGIEGLTRHILDLSISDTFSAEVVVNLSTLDDESLFDCLWVDKFLF